MLDINIKELDDIVGQKHLVGKYGIIRKMIENKKIYSCIFFGLPGIGKTTLTKVICNSLKIEYFSFNPTFDENKVSHCFPVYLPWNDGTGCHDLRFLNVEL